MGDCSLWILFLSHYTRLTLIPPQLLHPDFLCPICAGYMKKTVLVRQCMHRFCERCITDSISRAKRECPTCRIKIKSRRDWSRDERFDQLMEGILGNVEEQDEREADQNVSWNKGKQQSTTRRQRESRAHSKVSEECFVTCWT